METKPTKQLNNNNKATFVIVGLDFAALIKVLDIWLEILKRSLGKIRAEILCPGDCRTCSCLIFVLGVLVEVCVEVYICI